MNTERIEQLIEKFEEGRTSLDEEAELRDFFRSDKVPEHLKSHAVLFQYYEQMHEITPSDETDFFAKIESEKTEIGSSISINSHGFPGGALVWSIRIAAGLILLLMGFAAGLLVRQDKSGTNQRVDALQQEVQQMKQALVYGAYQQTSASERISAVNLSTRIPLTADVPDGEISEILVYTMNNDDNINVRQAAAEALFRFGNESEIRQALVRSLAQQSDPLMQITLIEMLVKLKEKSAVNEMQKLLMSTDTREVVKTRLKAGIAELKT